MNGNIIKSQISLIIHRLEVPRSQSQMLVNMDIMWYCAKHPYVVFGLIQSGDTYASVSGSQ